MLDDAGEDLRERVEAYYRESCDEVSHAVQKRAEMFDVDAEAKETLVEALNAHKSDYGRSTCRLLLPEIERVALVELQRKELGVTHVDKVLGKLSGSLGR
ncbi:hypothetical protein [Bradyrhizobium vignae]|uniref:hypothetical protein n=1 Tax=Bradyrhizobium vignae TaxID=1549949 RepID=UPI00100A9ED0|nr:hypothetical protein [Bradyrhizobium vignae]RXG97177.1 hypothetical protein EAV90_22660 [Bradyrhizobium vignae]